MVNTSSFLQYALLISNEIAGGAVNTKNVARLEIFELIPQCMNCPENLACVGRLSSLTEQSRFQFTTEGKTKSLDLPIHSVSFRVLAQQY